jgi:hypothetical protein
LEPLKAIQRRVWLKRRKVNFPTYKAPPVKKVGFLFGEKRK